MHGGPRRCAVSPSSDHILDIDIIARFTTFYRRGLLLPRFGGAHAGEGIGSPPPIP